MQHGRGRPIESGTALLGQPVALGEQEGAFDRTKLGGKGRFDRAKGACNLRRHTLEVLPLHLR